MHVEPDSESAKAWSWEQGSRLRCKVVTKALAIRLGPSLKLSSSFSATLVFGLLRLRDISKQIFYSPLTIHFPRLDRAMSSYCLASEIRHKRLFIQCSHSRPNGRSHLGFH